MLKLERMDDIELPNGHQGGKPRLWAGRLHLGQFADPNRPVARIESQSGFRPKCDASEFFVQVVIRL